MKRFAQLAVQNRKAFVFMAFILSMAGAYVLFQIPQGVFPEAEFPRIQVLVDYGLAPLTQMEAEIVKPIEEAVMMIPGVVMVRSNTNRGSSEINIHFDWHQEMFQAYQLVQAQVGGVQKDLPEGVQISIRRINTSTFPIAGFSLYSDKRSLLELRDLAVYVIRPQLANIPGIFNIEVLGGDQREYRVILDPAKLAAYHLDYQTILEALRATNQVQFVGRLHEQNQLYLNIADNRFHSLQDIGQTIVAERYPRPIRLVDVARLEPSRQETFIKTRSNFHDAVMVNVIVQPGVNSVAVMKQVDRRLKAIRQRWPADVQLVKWYDLTDFIRSSIRGVYVSILLGALFTTLILLVFLRRLRITLVTAAIIPVALLISFIGMKLFHMDLNLMSLGGLAASIGILVDNAIVVIENIERYLEAGYSRNRAVVEASGEIISPLLGATLTTLVVFIPLVFLSGVPGIFFRALAGTLAIVIAVSMLLATFLTPALAASFLSTRPKSPGRFLPRLVGLHQRFLGALLGKTWVALLTVAVLAAFILFSYLRIPSGFLPEWDEGTIVLDFLAPPGSSVEGSYQMLHTIETYLKTIPEVENYSLRIGTSLGHPRLHPNDGDFLISLKKDRHRSVFEIMDQIREAVEQMEPRLETELFQVLPDRLNSDLAGEIAPIVVKVFGNDLPRMQAIAREIARRLEKVPHVVDVYQGFSPSEPELTVRVLPEKAARLGLSVAQVDRALELALWGKVSTRVIQGLKIIPVRLRYDPGMARHFEQVRRIPLFFPHLDRPVLLEEVAEVKKSPGLTDVEHENLSLVVYVSAQLSGGDLGGTVRRVKQALADLTLPPGITLQLGGAYASQQRSFLELLLVLVFGALMVYTILLFEFRSPKTAGVILLGTLLAITGVFLALWVTAIPLDISAFMGMIMILGVVVNNGILVIDYTELYLQKEGRLKQALLEACAVRLRPVLMTTLSTIVGFLPLALAIGEGSEMLRPLAVAMIGGMSLSIALSLFLIPMLYYAVHRKAFVGN